MAKKKKVYLPLFKMLGGGRSKAFDIGEGEQEGYLKPAPGQEEEEENTGWKGNLSGLCEPPQYQFPKAKGKRHPVSCSSINVLHSGKIQNKPLLVVMTSSFFRLFWRSETGYGNSSGKACVPLTSYISFLVLQFCTCDSSDGIVRGFFASA